MKKMQLAEEICAFYNHKMKVINGCIFTTDMTGWNRPATYESVDEMLNAWLPTMLAANEETENLGPFYTWKENELNLIPDYRKE